MHVESAGYTNLYVAFSPVEFYRASVFTAHFDIGVARAILPLLMGSISSQDTRRQNMGSIPKQIIVIEGIRRCGKTYVMYQVYCAKNLIKSSNNLQQVGNHLISRQKIPSNQVYYIQVNTAIQQQLWSNFFSFLEYLIEQKGVTYLLLDEIQNVPQWGGIVRAINDKFVHVQLILCGSTTGLAQYARFINYFQISHYK